MGKRSQRNKLYEVHNWIRKNETDLMKLKLQAWYGKGYKIWENQHPSLAPNYLAKFVDKDNITTRKLYNVSQSEGNQLNIGYASGIPLYLTEANTYEDFVDVTLLKHTETATENVFYLGVQNRRTDPTIYFTEISDDKHLLFLSYSEFQDLCKNGGKNPLRNGSSDPSYSAAVWQSYWWKKLGCREINIPFDYVSTNKDHYNLLKVEELSGEFYDGTTKIADNSLPFHLQSKYYHKVDTVLGQDGILRLKMQPGQGKILKVTVLKPDLTVTGELDHSNQTKLVAHPVLNPITGNETDELQYHMVYYRNTSYNKKGVFYRRSKPIKKSDGTENIVWDAEMLISNNIKVKNPALQDIECNPTVNNPENIFYDCDYPSIVVRKDNVNNKLKAYITYSCNKPNSAQNLNAFIALNVLEVTSKVNVIPVSNRVYEYYMASNNMLTPANTTEFGNPVINASADYNFIAWSDAQKRIIVSYMNPYNTFLSETLQVNNLNFGNLPNSISKHPSLNSYSKISAGENNCALVWQQQNPSGNPSIYYTRVRLNQNNNLEVYSSNNYKGSNISKINNIVKLNYKNNYCSFPVVLRDMRDFTYSANPVNRIDYVYWSELNGTTLFFDYITKSSIVGTGILNSDISNANTSKITKLNEMKVEDYIFSSIDPNLSLPHGIYNSTNQKVNVGTHVLNFKRTKGKYMGDWGFPELIDNSIYNQVVGSGLFTHSLTTIIMFRGVAKTEKIATNTDQVHLSQYKENNYFNKVWRNRRIYEESNYSPPRIVSNGRYFYKNNVEEVVENEPFVGFRKNTNYYSISNPYVNSQEVGLVLPYIINTDTTESKFIVNLNQDTIFSNWFDVNTVADLNFKCYGFNDTIMVAKIQKQSENSFINLNLPLMTSDTTGKLGQYTLINGGLSSYRLCFIRLDTNYQYTETLVLDGLPVSDTVMLKGTGTTKNIIDLSGNFNLTMGNGYFDLSISPNPADEIVYMTPLYNDLKNQNLIEVEILGNLGNSIHKKVVKSGETFSFITSDLSQGIYIVNCREITSDWLAPSFLKATKFVINR